MFGFIFIAVILLSIPAFIFSILSWRLRTDVMFWLGTVFTGLLVILFLFNYEIVWYMIMNIDTFIYGIFLLATVGIPVYFLVSSKMPKSGKGESDVTDDYLNKIIESEDEDLDFER